MSPTAGSLVLLEQHVASKGSVGGVDRRLALALVLFGAWGRTEPARPVRRTAPRTQGEIDRGIDGTWDGVQYFDYGCWERPER